MPRHGLRKHRDGARVIQVTAAALFVVAAVVWMFS